jgi:hypothetical protein
VAVIVAERAEDLPTLSASPDRAPLLLFMPTRRVAPSRWLHLWQTYCQSKSSTLLILDKSLNGDATTYFTKLVAESQSDGLVILLRRPLDENPFHSVAALTADASQFVVQFHDDDDWAGLPSLPGDLHGVISFTTMVRRTSSQSQVETRSFLSRFFGAIRADVWTRFMHYCGTKEAGTNVAIDLTLSNLVATLGDSGLLQDYEYIYNDHHWASWSLAVASNSQAMHALGWRTTDAVPAVHWSQLLDDLEVLYLFRDLMSEKQMQDALAERLRFPLHPAGGTTLDAAMLRLCPPTLRAAIVRSRGRGRNLGRLRGVIHGAARSRISSEEIALLGGYGAISLAEILDVYLPALRGWATPALEDQFTMWTSSILKLQKYLPG